MSNQDQIALTFEDKQISYKSLKQEVDRLAFSLKNGGVPTGSIVGICMEPGIDQITAILAVLKCGAIYLPINPKLPVERINYMLKDSAAKLIIVSDE